MPENGYELPEEEARKLPSCERLLELAPETSRAPTESLASALLIYSLYRRAAKTYAAILLLCRNGFGDQALMLARILFEDIVEAHWVKTNPEAAIERFNDVTL